MVQSKRYMNVYVCICMSTIQKSNWYHGERVSLLLHCSSFSLSHGFFSHGSNQHHHWSNSTCSPQSQHQWSHQNISKQWIGISCSSLHNRMSALSISSMALSGSFPPQLGNLSFLVSVDLSGNNSRDFCHMNLFVCSGWDTSILPSIPWLETSPSGSNSYQIFSSLISEATAS